MLFSIVIPTHDRLSLVKDAIETVRQQNYGEWELIVFDNGSSEDIGGYISSLNHPSIRCVRSDDFLPVTESWNRAIDLARGEYVTLLGDDDGLVPGYFQRLENLINRFGMADVFYSALIQFFQPGVAPWERAGYVADVKNGFFFEGRSAPFLLSDAEARTALNGSLNLRRNFTYNIQVFVCRKGFLKSIRTDGKIFHSPFPDYYFANIVMSEAKSIVVDPVPLAIASISKASFGYTLFNNEEEKGNAILNAELSGDLLYSQLEARLLRGPAYQTNFIVTMAHVERNCRRMICDPPDFQRYRKFQVYSNMVASGGFTWRRTATGREQWRRLDNIEKLWALKQGAEIWFARRLKTVSWLERYGQSLLDRIDRQRRPYAFDAIIDTLDVGTYKNVRQVFAALKKNALETRRDRIAAVYLARFADGPSAFLEFVSSYKEHPAGVDHDLIVIYKGYDDPAELKKAKRIFNGVQTLSIEVNDEGFDIGAYLKVAQKFDHDYFCFLNTFTRIEADGWLANLYKHASAHGVGIVGAMGSYESLFTSLQLINKTLYLCNKLGIDYDDKISYFYEFIVREHCKPWAEHKPNIDMRFGKGILGRILGMCEKIRHLLHRAAYKTAWSVRAQMGRSNSVYNEYPSFPNPHIRSNGFMVSRNILHGYPARPVVEKLDACYFESGHGGLTSYVRRNGLAAVVVGRDGVGYDVSDWTRSNTFRLGNQDNLLISDNQSRIFDVMSPGSQATHLRMTWGDYLRPALQGYYDLGFKFRKKPWRTRSRST